MVTYTCATFKNINYILESYTSVSDTFYSFCLLYCEFIFLY